MARKDFAKVRDTFANDNGLPFGKLLTREFVLKTLADEGHQYRQRVFCPLTTLWAWLSQCLSQDKSLNEAVSRVLAHRVATGLPACSASRSSYGEARGRFPLAVIERLAKEIGQNVHASADNAWHWRGRDVYLADGTGLSMPDTPENQLVFPQAKTQAPGIGFPVMRAVALISLPTGAVVDFAFTRITGKGTGEGQLLRGMLDTLKAGDIIVADRLFPSYVTLAAMQQRGIDIVSVSHVNRVVDFSEGIQLGENDHIVEWQRPRYRETMPLEELRELPEAITVREFIIDVEGDDGSRKQAVVVSTITNPTIPQEELSELYWRRWNCELDLRSIKQSMHLDVLRAKTPDVVAKEIYAHLLAWNLLRGVMTESAKRTGLTPRQISVKGTMQSVESFTPAMMATGPNEALYDAFLTTVSAHRVGNRPGRLEPRYKKRRPSWKRYMTIPRDQSRRRLASEGRNPLS
ncbi:MAG: IS4 family transposase [Planctomycetaceae bacterium]|nr:IS4 family transposase [Planctomycetaceae bacterium]